MIPRQSVINGIIKNYNLINPSYLEIGVWTGETFKHINSNNKDGVDPGQYCDCSLVNYKMTSDEFFSNHIQKKYDIIFIDGLHTAYQVTKDIYNSINNLNDGGWIILDDVFPHCEYEQERLNLRKSGSQTGDVWKALYNVLDTIKDISEIMYFEDSTERGNFLFRVKKSGTNIIIDSSIPTKNIDGWYEGNDVEWDKYTYTNDFNLYISKLYEINTTSAFLKGY
jgi:hypothetical protein